MGFEWQTTAKTHSFAPRLGVYWMHFYAFFEAKLGVGRRKRGETRRPRIEDETKKFRQVQSTCFNDQTAQWKRRGVAILETERNYRGQSISTKLSELECTRMETRFDFWENWMIGRSCEVNYHWENWENILSMAGFNRAGAATGGRSSIAARLTGAFWRGGWRS